MISKVKDHLLSLIDRGLVGKVINKLEMFANADIKKVDNLIEYLTRFKDCVHYQKFKDLGLPIGSGEVESSHKYIPQKRLKIAGATWHPNTINPMLALRIIKANNWWNEFWNQYNETLDLKGENSDNNSHLNLVA